MFFVGLCLVICIGLLSIYKEISVIGISQKDRCPTSPLLDYEYNVQYIQISSNPLDIDQIYPILHIGQTYSCIDDARVNTCTALHTYTNPTITIQRLQLINKHYTISKLIIHMLICIFGPIIHGLNIYNRLPRKNNIIYKYLYFLLSTCLLYLNYCFYFHYSYETVIYINNCQDLHSSSTTSSSTDITGLCHILSTCGLKLVSVSINNNIIMYFYTTFLFLYLFITVITTTLYFIFLCIYDMISVIAYYFDRHRLSILNKRGDELTIALENAPLWFINEYIHVISQYPSNIPPLSDRYDNTLTHCHLSLTLQHYSYDSSTIQQVVYYYCR